MALSEKQLSEGLKSFSRKDAVYPRPRVLTPEASKKVERDVDYTIGFLRRDENPPIEAGTVRSLPVYEGKIFTFRDPTDEIGTPLFVEHYNSLSEPLSSSQRHLEPVIEDLNRPNETTAQPKRKLIKSLITVLISTLPKT